MITFSQLGTSSSGTDVWTLEFRYADFCTNFTHTTTEGPIFGGARMAGGSAFRLSDTSTVSLGSAPVFPFLAAGSISAGSTAFVGMFASNVAHSFSANYSYSGSSLGFLVATMVQILSLSGDSITGFAQAAIGNTNAPISFTIASVDLGRGGSCPV